MKKVLMVGALAAVALVLSGCGSLRNPSGANHNKVYYNTFFGVSIESAVYGDGLIVNTK